MMRRLGLLAVMLVGSVHVAGAHEGIGPHGGRLADTGTHHLELVVADEAVTVFLSTNANAPVQTKDLSGLAIVSGSSGSSRITLAPSGENRLAGKATTPVSAKAKTVVRVTMPDGNVIQGSFD
jgi:hypothetical protein